MLCGRPGCIVHLVSGQARRREGRRQGRTGRRRGTIEEGQKEEEGGEKEEEQEGREKCHRRREAAPGERESAESGQQWCCRDGHHFGGLDAGGQASSGEGREAAAAAELQPPADDRKRASTTEILKPAVPNANAETARDHASADQIVAESQRTQRDSARRANGQIESRRRAEETGVSEAAGDAQNRR